MRSLAVTDSLLVIQSPAWIGWTLVVVGVLLTVAAIVFKRPRPIRLGAFLGTLLLLYGGWHLLRNVITLESRGFYIESRLGEEERIGWLQVSGIDTGGLSGAKNAEPEHVVLQLRTSREVPLDLSGLSDEEKARVVAFVRARIKP